jgi:hypothetical protein
MVEFSALIMVQEGTGRDLAAHSAFAGPWLGLNDTRRGGLLPIRMI